MRRAINADLLVAAGFVLATVMESTLRFRDTPGLLAFNVAGASWLFSLAVRRTHPLVPIIVITAAGVLGTVVTGKFWPDAPDGAGVWIFALMLAAYSLGAHGRGRSVVLGGVLPLVVVVVADVTTRTGWARVSGILFVTLFVGVLPTVIGRMVRIRGDRLRILHGQRERIVRAHAGQQESAALAERLQTVERLQPILVDGLQGLAAAAESGGDAAAIETSARELLTRTREEVVALTAPVGGAAAPAVVDADHLTAVRTAAQPWTVIAAGAVVAGLVAESRVLDVDGPGWAVVPAALVVGAPLALAWWRPVLSVVLAWAGAGLFSHSVAPLDGSLSETGFAFAAAFAVGALSRRPVAVVGLVVCWLGQLVGVGTDDPLGGAVFLLLAWLGGLAVNEASRLVEQTRVNNEVLAEQEAAAAARAVVDERLRLAREIHDAIGHSLTVVALQAGAARRLGEADPERARDVMRTVAAAARSGVASLTLDGADGDLPGLLDRVRATGLAVEADVGDADRLMPGQRSIAFRLVQEALTNVLRHAPGSRAHVTVRQHASSVEVVVANTASTGAGSGPGTRQGLAGLQERITAGGGEVTWSRRDDGGFEVRARIPVASVVSAS
jgi:signal transduction histidine kinase